MKRENCKQGVRTLHHNLLFPITSLREETWCHYTSRLRLHQEETYQLLAQQQSPQKSSKDSSDSEDDYTPQVLKARPIPVPHQRLSAVVQSHNPQPTVDGAGNNVDLEVQDGENLDVARVHLESISSRGSEQEIEINHEVGIAGVDLAPETSVLMENQSDGEANV